MRHSTLTIESEFDLPACQQIQEKLAAWGICSACYDAQGNCLRAAPAVPCGPGTSDAWQNDYPSLRLGMALTPEELEQWLTPGLENPNTKWHRLTVKSADNPPLHFFYRLTQENAGERLTAASEDSCCEKLIETLFVSYQEQARQQAEIDHLAGTLSQRYEEIHLLHYITGQMKFSQKPHVVLPTICTEIRDVLQAGEIAILWKSVPNENFKHLTSAGFPQWLEHLEIPLWTKLNKAAQHPCAMINKQRQNETTFNWPAEINDLLVVPICQGELLMGGIIAFNKKTGQGFDSVDAKLLISIASEIAGYLENCRLYRNLHDLFIGSLQALTNSIDAKDPYTCGHSERVARLSRLIAEQLSMSDSEADDIYLTGLLHDIGKIGVNESVLSKAGKLNAQEFQQIKKHPRLGSTILSGIRQMHTIAQGVLSHHERFDGKGYPHGLRQDEIPLAGRIIMLADSYDAMTTTRPYQPRRTVEQAMEEIARCQGTQFDPEVTNAFFQIEPKELHIITHCPASPHFLDHSYRPLLT